MTHRPLLVATRSKGKLPEIIALLTGLPYDVISLTQVPELDGFASEEPALTIEGNAIIKAMTYGSKARMLTLSDDVGLEVDALGGRPGVHTARYAPGTDHDRCLKLLDELKGIPEGKRTARFRAVAAIFDPETQRIRTCEGIYEGEIATELRGGQGFGYDPVFFSAELRKTSAEMSQDEKNSVSHRGKALRQMRELIQQGILDGK